MANSQVMEGNSQEYLTENEARAVQQMFQGFWKSYKQKTPEVSDKEWIEQILKKEFPKMKEEEIRQESEDIVTSIKVFDRNLASCNEAAKKGTSKERWLADKLQEMSVGMAVNEYGKKLQEIENALYAKNMELADALSRSTDGHIMMSPNLDGNIAEHMAAKTAELNAALQGRNISVEVRDSHAANSVDVRAINHDTGQYQNYQLKFGKDAKATIELLERGNYNNQRIVVPSEQLEEVQAYFKEKGSSKTITNHIEAWGAEGKSFTKEDMKALQKTAQSENAAPELNFSHYQTKDLALNIGKNAGAMALQSAAVTTGLDIAAKVFKGEEIDGDELIENAIKTGADASVKTVTAGALEVAVKKGCIKCIPQATPAGVIANIACVGIENAKVLAKVASGGMSVTKGLDQMGRVTTSMVGGLSGMAKGAALGTALGTAAGPVGAVIGGFVGGMVGYSGGSKIGNAVYNVGKKAASAAKTVAKAVVDELKSAGEAVANGINAVKRKFLDFLGF